MKLPASDYLRSRWLETVQHIGGRPDALEFVISDILQIYTTPWRSYHTTEHLKQSFITLDRVFKDTPDLGPIELAIWYHDYAYDPSRHDNEERSADIAFRSLTSNQITSEEVARKVSSLILATKLNHIPSSHEERVMIDVDRSILGSHGVEFDKYEIAIRKEFSNMFEKDFKEKRVAFLSSLLKDGHVFLTREARIDLMELRARYNIQRSIKKLIEV